MKVLLVNGNFFMHGGIVHPGRMRYNSIEKTGITALGEGETYDIRKAH